MDLVPGRTPRLGRRRDRVLWLGALCLLAAAAPLHGDASQTGTLAGVVVDASGTPLEAAAVVATGGQARREGTTDATGRFRFPALPPGDYRLEAELAGLHTAPAEASVFAAKTTEVRLLLAEPGGVAPTVEAQSIEVVGEAPVIDKLDPRLGGSVTATFLADLPVVRFYQSAVQVLPGVAGGADGNPNVSGSLREYNRFLVDGIDTTDAVTGLFGLHLAYEAIQEVDVTTAAAPAQYGGSSGAVINVVTRSADNEYHGAARWLATDGDWDGAYRYPPEQVAHLGAELDAVQRGPAATDQSAAFTVSGPLAPQRLWLFGAYENDEHTFWGPTRQGTLWDEGVDLEGWAAKLTAQPRSTITLVAQHTADKATFAGFTPFDRNPGEILLGVRPPRLRGNFVEQVPGDIFALQAHEQRGSFTRLQWSHAIGRSFALELTFADQERELLRGQPNRRGSSGDAPHLAFDPVDPAAGIFTLVMYNGITDVGVERRPRRQGNLAITAYQVTGAADHEIKAGVDYQRTESERDFNFPGRPGVDPFTGMPVAGQLFVDFDLRASCTEGSVCVPFDPRSGGFQPFNLLRFWVRDPHRTREETVAAYLSDAVVLGRWLISLGTRWERVEGIDAVAGTTLLDDQGISPRASLVYDVLGDGTALFSLSAGRYREPFLQRVVDSFGTLEAFSGFTQYSWNLGDPACFDGTVLGDPSDLGSPCWIVGENDYVQPPFVIQGAAADRRLRRSAVDELVAGFERQLTPHLGVSLHYVDRRWRDLWDNVLQGELDETGTFFVTLSSELRNLPQAERRYRAVQLLVQQRLARRFQLLASYTRSIAEGNLFRADGFDSFADFSQTTDINLVNRFGRAPYDRTHQGRIFASYAVPVRTARLWLGTVLRYESGIPYQLERAGDPRGSRFLTPRGSFRLSPVLQWDLAIGADVPLGSALRGEAKLEAFNVTGEQQVLSVETLEGDLFARPRSIQELQAPRSFRLSLAIRF